MNAFPQLVRCFEAQWNGLTPDEQEECLFALSDQGFNATLQTAPVIRSNIPMWWTEAWRGDVKVWNNVLMSVKED